MTFLHAIVFQAYFRLHYHFDADVKVKILIVRWVTR